MNLRANAQTPLPSAMAQSLIRLMVIIAFGSFSIIGLVTVVRFAGYENASSRSFVGAAIFFICLAAIASIAFNFGLKKLLPFIDESSLAQARFLDTLNIKYVDAAILFSAALSLFIELAIIRWQSSVLPFFAFYKNFSLLAGFVGLGVGYALATRDRIPLVTVLPLFAWQFAFMTLVRYVPGLRSDYHNHSVQRRARLTMGIWPALQSTLHTLPVWVIGDRFPNYGFNFHACGPAVWPAYGTPHQVAGVWTELARQLTWRPSHAHGEFSMDASARLVRTVFPCNFVIHVENAFFNDCRSFLHGGLHDCLGLAGESSLEPSLFPVPTIGNWAQ